MTVQTSFAGSLVHAPVVARRGVTRRFARHRRVPVSLAISASFRWSLFRSPSRLACIPLWYYQVTANIMSLGGIALAIGVLVDASIVMVENGYRRVAEGRSVEAASEQQVLLNAAHQVGRPVFFSLVIIVVSFLPVFLLEAEEGRLFRAAGVNEDLDHHRRINPCPDTGAGSDASADPPRPRGRTTTKCPDAILYSHLRADPATDSEARRLALLLNAAVIPLTVPLLFGLGHEFMPPLYEGSLLYMPTAPPGLSMTEATRLLQVQDRVLKEFPEVERVFGTIGRSTTATDNSTYAMVNTTLTLKPREQWRAGVTFDGLQAEMNAGPSNTRVPERLDATYSQPSGHAFDRHENTRRTQSARE